jgi:hypothetical protein
LLYIHQLITSLYFKEFLGGIVMILSEEFVKLLGIETTVKKILEGIPDYQDYKIYYGGYTCVVLSWWEKPHWKSAPYTKQNDGSQHYSIHYELQWKLKKEEIFFYLHYHPTPPVEKKVFENSVSYEFRMAFYRARKRFYDYVSERLSHCWSWEITSSSQFYPIGEYKFKKKISLDELKNKIIEIMKETTPVIEQYIKIYHL